MTSALVFYVLQKLCHVTGVVGRVTDALDHVTHASVVVRTSHVLLCETAADVSSATVLYLQPLVLLMVSMTQRSHFEFLLMS